LWPTLLLLLPLPLLNRMSLRQHGRGETTKSSQPLAAKARA
jgi:hypothetical protein